MAGSRDLVGPREPNEVEVVHALRDREDPRHKEGVGLHVRELEALRRRGRYVVRDRDCPSKIGNLRPTKIPTSLCSQRWALDEERSRCQTNE